MATTLEDVATLAVNTGFIARIRSAMVRAAIDIGASVLDSSTYEQFRHALAVNAVLDQQPYAERFAWLVASRTSPVNIESTSDDTDIQNALNSVWDAMAGAGLPPS